MHMPVFQEPFSVKASVFFALGRHLSAGLSASGAPVLFFVVAMWIWGNPGGWPGGAGGGKGWGEGRS